MLLEQWCSAGDDREMIAMHRLYFWFKGAPADRPGGPWWYRDFLMSDVMRMFHGDIKRFVHEARYLYKEQLPQHDPMNIYPPPEAVVVKADDC